MPVFCMRPQAGIKNITAPVSVQLVHHGAAMHHVSSQHGPYILHCYFGRCKIMRTTLTTKRPAKRVICRLDTAPSLFPPTGQQFGYMFKIYFNIFSFLFHWWQCLSVKAVTGVTKSLCNGLCEEMECPNKHFPRVWVIQRAIPIGCQVEPCNSLLTVLS